jgi:hypothetical protein
MDTTLAFITLLAIIGFVAFLIFGVCPNLKNADGEPLIDWKKLFSIFEYNFEEDVWQRVAVKIEKKKENIIDIIKESDEIDRLRYGDRYKASREEILEKLRKRQDVYARYQMNQGKPGHFSNGLVKASRK